MRRMIFMRKRSDELRTQTRTCTQIRMMPHSRCSRMCERVLDSIYARNFSVWMSEYLTLNSSMMTGERGKPLNVRRK